MPWLSGSLAWFQVAHISTERSGGFRICSGAPFFARLETEDDLELIKSGGRKLPGAKHSWFVVAKKKGCRTLWILNWYFLQIVMLHFHQNITVQQMVSMTFSQFVGRLMLSQTSSVSVVNERGLVAMRVWVKFTYQASTKMHTLNGWKWGIPKSTWLLQNYGHPWRLDDLGLPPWLRKPIFKECGKFFGIRSLDQTKVFLENLVFFRRSNHFPAKSLEELTPKKPLLSDLQRIRIANQSLQIKWSIFVYMQIYVFIFQIYYMHEYDMFYYNYMVHIYMCICLMCINMYQLNYT